MAWQLFNWLMVLGKADLSYAQPITALSYVSVFCLFVFYLKEAADLIQIAGIVFVLAGVWCISQTDHATQSKEGEALGQAAVGVLLIVICALLEGVAQVLLKKFVLGAVRRYLWISIGVVILLIQK